jgi:hypothetical protein
MRCDGDDDDDSGLLVRGAAQALPLAPPRSRARQECARSGGWCRVAREVCQPHACRARTAGDARPAALLGPPARRAVCRAVSRVAVWENDRAHAPCQCQRRALRVAGPPLALRPDYIACSARARLLHPSRLRAEMKLRNLNYRVVPGLS